jgi:MFS family permease
MIAVALVTLRSDFDLDIATVTWVITTYYLASAVLQPLMGRLADRYGPRRIFTLGMVIVILSGVLAPFATNFVLVCVARVLLAVGTATAFPSAAAMLRAISKTSGRSAQKMIGRIQMVDTGTAAIGPVVGGVLVTAFGWPAIFVLNIPLALIALVSTRMLAPKDDPHTRTTLRQTLVDSDIPGILAFSITIIALLMFLLDLTSGPMWWLIAVVLIGAALFAWRELRCAKPFVDLRLLGTNAALLRVYVGMILANLTFYSALFGIPQFLEDHAGYRTDVVGLLMMPLAAFTLLLTPFVERLIDRRGLRTSLILGGAGMVVAGVVLLVLAATTSPIVVLLVAAAVGIPYCVLVISLTQSLYVAARPEDVGEAAGLFQTARSLGGIASTVVVGITFASGTEPTDWLLFSGTVAVFALIYLVIMIVWRSRHAESTGSGR